MMKLSDFKYNLPKTAIAKYSASPRDKAKLMVVNRETQEFETSLPRKQPINNTAQ